MAESASCHRCGMDESPFHAFRDCIRSKDTWRSLRHDLDTSFWNQQDWVTWIEINLNPSNPNSSDDWSLLFGITVWKMWQFRNEETFQNTTYTLSRAIIIIRTTEKEVKRARNIYPTGKEPHNQSPENERWIPPPSGWAKINSDGAVSQITNKAAAGGVIRDSNSNWISGFTSSLGQCSPLEAELWGVFHGLQLAWSLGLRQIIMEVDCLEAYQSLSSWNPHAIQTNMWYRIQYLLNRDWTVLLSHTRREGNQIADHLAKLGFTSHGNEPSTLTSPPAPTISLLMRDKPP